MGFIRREISTRFIVGTLGKLLDMKYDTAQSVESTSAKTRGS
jgi:hypothetical protein